MYSVPATRTLCSCNICKNQAYVSHKTAGEHLRAQKSEEDALKKSILIRYTVMLHTYACNIQLIQVLIFFFFS